MTALIVVVLAIVVPVASFLAFAIRGERIRNRREQGW